MGAWKQCEGAVRPVLSADNAVNGISPKARRGNAAACLSTSPFAMDRRSGETAAWGAKHEPIRPARIRPSAGADRRADGAALGGGDRRLGRPDQVRRPAL